MPIKSFRHKGLRELFEEGRSRSIRADQAKRLRRLLTALDAAATIDEMNGLIFRFEDGDAFDLDLVDYH